MSGSLRKQLSLFGIVATLFIVLLGGVALYVANLLTGALDQTSVAAVAMRYHMQADMMHDAIRADIVSGILAGKNHDTKAIDEARKQMQEHLRDLNTSMEANQKAALSSETQQATAQVLPELGRYGALGRAVLDDLDRDLAGSEAKLPEFLTQFTKLEGAMAGVRDKIERDVKATQEQAEELTMRTRTILVVSASIAVVLLVMASTAMYRNITGALTSLRLVAERVNDGDLQARANLKRDDELGQFASAFDRLLEERLAQLDKTARENEALNHSVVALLQTVFQLSQRDLTVRAPVSDDIVGTVSASVNQLADETARTLTEVSQVSEDVRTAASSVQEQAAIVERTAATSRESLLAMMQSLKEATDQLLAVAELAQNSNRSAQDASSATDQALQTVNQTVNGMSALREVISTIEKRFKRLGERSQEISSAVNLINTISERTHVLALNASMQAAVAGEAGRGFAVVAEEVQRLSDNSRQATAQIATLVGNIQAETNETLYTVNQLITETVRQTEIAQRAGAHMAQTQLTTSQLVGHVGEIASFSRRQEALANTLRKYISDINAGTENTSRAIGAQVEVTNSLSAYARKLSEAIRQFRLPMGNAA